MRRIISLLLITSLATQLPAANAAPSVAAAQQEVNRLRTQAATKFEAANETKIKVEMLQKETSVLKAKEALARNERDEASNTLARMAIDQYKSDGFSQGFGLLFSRDPSKYLSDASILEMVGNKYSSSIRKYASAQQRLEASQLVVGDRTALLQAQQKRLNAEVLSARAALTKAEKILTSMKKEDRARLARAEKARENKILNTSKKYANSYKGDNSRGSIALKYALRQVGDIYVWAASGPTRWDCSGLTLRSFQQAGVSLPHSSRIQIRYGKSVSHRSLKPGDLLFFGKPVSHVSIYMGKGKMVQAPRPGKRVEVVAFTLRFGSKPFVGARRL
jgi:cell wall-associated NlpC family hydrolase